ncbi:hypothetical protein BGZ65_001346 [Modicella reniformis]|uniref:F-box domain-containing protein n=1 Tax=Modicella reniformis TaxID=1440133 RepID=A0A9P6MBH0_9FUNG|nr:hypothetical protein BGZ65_001346 [Modicella reniformis]
MHPHPLSIPEILDHVAKYLLPKDILNCLRVSRAFHTSLIRSLWKTIRIYNDGIKGRPLQYPLGENLRRYKHHIQRLIFIDDSPPPYLTLRGCDCLQILRIKISRLDRELSSELAKDHQDRILYGFAGLIVAHISTLREIAIQLSPRHMIAPSKELWEALLKCGGLKRLDLSHISVPDCLQPLFLRVCAKPQRLSLSSIALSGWPATMSDIALTGPRDLSISKHPKDRQVITMSHSNQALLIRHCLNLESLNWRGGHGRHSDVFQSDIETATFYNTLAMDPWPLPHLETLNLSWTTVKDQELASVLRGMYRLKSLKVIGTRFGPLSLQAITMDRMEGVGSSHRAIDPQGPCYERKLCDSIEVLLINDCIGVSSKMIQTIMESCPRLTQFHADTVTMTDIAQGHEWACLRMRDLQFYLKADVNVSYHHDDADLESGHFAEMQRGVYSRLAMLTWLERLHLTNHVHRTVEKRTLDLKLKAGMDLLAWLTNLKEVTYLFDDHQRIGVDEAQWIKQYWPRLKIFKGYPNDHGSVRQQIKEILKPIAIEDTPIERLQ